MAHETPTERRAQYAAAKAAHRCIKCRAPARQHTDGHWLTLCARHAAQAKQHHRQRYLRLIAEHRCISCRARAWQHEDGYWFTRCEKHQHKMNKWDRANERLARLATRVDHMVDEARRLFPR